MSDEVPVETKSGKTVYIKLATLEKAELDALSQMHLRNISGSSPYRTGRGWLSAWKAMWGYTGESNPDCAIFTCGKKARVGGHVRYNIPHGAVYIIPICGECNSTTYDEELRHLKRECDGHREWVRAIKQRYARILS